jgi:hypothetical protein
MNRSYSKIRHIQEANLMLERRLLNEQVTGDTTPVAVGGGGFVDREKVDVINGVQIPKNQLGSDGKPETYINKLIKSYGKLNFKDDK